MERFRRRAYLFLVIALSATTQASLAQVKVSLDPRHPGAQVGNTTVTGDPTKPASPVKVERPEGSATMSPLMPPIVRPDNNGEVAKAANKVADLQKAPLDAANRAAKASAELPKKAVDAAKDAITSPFKRLAQQAKQAFNDLVSRIKSAAPWIIAGVCGALFLTVFLGSLAAHLLVRFLGARRSRA